MTASKTHNAENRKYFSHSIARAAHSRARTHKKRPLKIFGFLSCGCQTQWMQTAVPRPPRTPECALDVFGPSVLLLLLLRRRRDLSNIYIFSIHRTVFEWWCYFWLALRSRRITTTITKRYDAIIQCETVLCDAHWADEHTPFQIYIFIHIVNTLCHTNRFSGFTWNDSPSGWRML